MRLGYRLRRASSEPGDGLGHEIDVAWSGDAAVIDVDGRPHRLTDVEVGTRSVSLCVDGRWMRVPFARDGARVLVWVRGMALEFRAAGDEEEARQAGSGGFHPEVRAPMPGKVLSVEVEPGQVVQADEVLVLMEAMKMETALRAPETCRVSEIRAQAGDLVTQDEVLLVLVQAEQPSDPD